MTAVQSLPEGRLLVDLGFRDSDGIIASYLLPEEEGWALVEVGPTTCRSGLLRGLREAGVEPREVRDVFVTHIHLDHAGGLGALVEELPRAQFYAHESGLPHLVDPSRLVESARRAWGEASDTLWGAVLPVPPGRLRALRGGERFPLRSGTLEVLPTPGHARHHLSFWDSGASAVMTGDGAGVLLPGARHVRPAVPPPDLDIPRFLDSLEVVRRRDPSWLWFSHFGPYDRASQRLDEVARGVREWTSVAEEVLGRGGGVAEIEEALAALERDRARREGEGEDLVARTGTISSLRLAAAGLYRYLTRTRVSTR
jgi:glyoxylase-like metal-dependent hydrolase (beta-lactamase superfamily II)